MFAMPLPVVLSCSPRIQSNVRLRCVFCAHWWTFQLTLKQIALPKPISQMVNLTISTITDTSHSFDLMDQRVTCHGSLDFLSLSTALRRAPTEPGGWRKEWGVACKLTLRSNRGQFHHAKLSKDIFCHLSHLLMVYLFRINNGIQNIRCTFVADYNGVQNLRECPESSKRLPRICGIR